MTKFEPFRMAVVNASYNTLTGVSPSMAFWLGNVIAAKAYKALAPEAAESALAALPHDVVNMAQDYNGATLLDDQAATLAFEPAELEMLFQLVSQCQAEHERVGQNDEALNDLSRKVSEMICGSPPGFDRPNQPR